MEEMNSKEIQSERLSINYMSNSNKNKFHAFLSGGNKKEKDNTQVQGNKANYLNSLLKKQFFNTINKTNGDISLNISVSAKATDIANPEDNTSAPKVAYPKKKPKNFLPQYLFDNINVNKNKKITRQTKNELRDILDLYEKQKNNMKKTEKDLEDAKEDLKKAKEARKKIMEEVYQIKKDIENINENNGNINASINNIPMNGNNNNLLNRSRLSLQPGTANMDLLKNLNLNKSQMDNFNQEDNEKKKLELDNQIKEYEDKISQLKFKNKSFVEDYDMLINDYKKNLSKNLKLKNCISDIDNKTKEALKEKADLKKYIDRIGKV
jgi:DNA repair exonuclease SbcCD ATPase subunit